MQLQLHAYTKTAKLFKKIAPKRQGKACEPGARNVKGSVKE